MPSCQTRNPSKIDRRSNTIFTHIQIIQANILDVYIGSVRLVSQSKLFWANQNSQLRIIIARNVTVVLFDCVVSSALCDWLCACFVVVVTKSKDNVAILYVCMFTQTTTTTLWNNKEHLFTIHTNRILFHLETTNLRRKCINGLFLLAVWMAWRFKTTKESQSEWECCAARTERVIWILEWKARIRGKMICRCRYPDAMSRAVESPPPPSHAIGRHFAEATAKKKSHSLQSSNSPSERIR